LAIIHPAAIYRAQSPAFIDLREFQAAVAGLNCRGDGYADAAWMTYTT